MKTKPTNPHVVVKQRLFVTILQTGSEPAPNEEEVKRAYSLSGKYEVDLKVLKL
jgi:hypothetical protein